MNILECSDAILDLGLKDLLLETLFSAETSISLKSFLCLVCTAVSKIWPLLQKTVQESRPHVDIGKVKVRSSPEHKLYNSEVNRSNGSRKLLLSKASKRGMVILQDYPTVTCPRLSSSASDTILYEHVLMAWKLASSNCQQAFAEVTHNLCSGLCSVSRHQNSPETSEGFNLAKILIDNINIRAHVGAHAVVGTYSERLRELSCGSEGSERIDGSDRSDGSGLWSLEQLARMLCLAAMCGFASHSSGLKPLSDSAVTQLKHTSTCTLLTLL